MAPAPLPGGLAEELAAVEVLRGSGLRRALDSVLAAVPRAYSHTPVPAPILLVA